MADPKEHFDLEPHDHVPEAPDVKPTGGPASPADAPPLLELVEDTCPKCGTVLRPDAVFCIKCGYDLRTNEVRKPTVGVETVFEKPKEDPREFSLPGRGSLQVLLGIGAVVTVGAMVVAGLNAPNGFLPVFAAVVLALYQIALHTGTGIVAVLVAARIAELKPGRMDLTAARVFVAFSTFQLIHSITFGEYRLLVTILMYPLAAAAYWGLVMMLFRKPRMVAVTVLVAHFVLWITVQAGMELAGYVSRTEAARAAATPPTPANPPPPQTP